MKRTTRVFALLLVLAISLSLSACGGSSESTVSSSSTTETSTATTTSEPKYGGELNVYYQELYTDYDPSAADNRNYALWFERLWTINLGENDPSKFQNEYVNFEDLTGQIAESWNFDSAAQTFTVKLRQDVYFQDKEPYNGRQLTAADVKWTYDRLFGWDGTTKVDCESDYSTSLYMLQSVEASDDYTVVFHFNSGNETAMADFMTTSVNIGGVEWDTLTADQKADWHYAAGTGPYILTDYAADSYMTFEKNSNYYAYDIRYPQNKLPYIDKITLTCITDSANRLTQFLSGKLDVLSWGGSVLGSTEIEQLTSTMSADAFKEYTYDSSPVGIGLKSNSAPLSDVRVRKALQMAINSDEINSAYYGYTDSSGISGAFALGTDYSSADSWSDDVKSSYQYDPDGAKALLAEAGYPDGFEFTVTIFSALPSDLFQLVADYLSKIGVTMKIEIASTPMEMMSIGYDESDPRCIFDSPGKYTVNYVMMYFRTGGNSDSIFHNDATFNGLCDQCNTATTMADRIKYAQELDEYFVEQHWILQLGSAEKVSSFFSSRVGGYTGERLNKNWNITPILSSIWVTD